MRNAQRLHAELAAYLQLHLHQHYAAGYRLPVSQEQYNYFLQEAQTRKYKAKTVAPPVVKELPMSSAAPPSAAAPVVEKVAEAIKPPTLQPKSVQKPAVTAAAPLAAKTKNTPAKREQSIKLNSGQPLEMIELDMLRQQIQTQIPSLTLSNTIPDDLEARRSRFFWLTHYTQLLLIAPSSSSQEEIEFLASVAKGVTARLAPATVVTNKEAEYLGGWEYLLSTAMPYGVVLTEDATKQEAMLVPLLVGKKIIQLSPASDYHNNVKKKRELWDQIRELLKSAK